MLHDGKTAHSMFKVPGIIRERATVIYLLRTGALWHTGVEAVNRALQDIMQNNRFMGSITLLVVVQQEQMK